MEEIIVWEEVIAKLDKLTRTLYEKEYFGFEASCEDYVNKIYDFIYKIPKLRHRKTKQKRHGSYFVKYEVKNKRTVYFITFDKNGNKYIIKNIFTSYEEEYPTYISD